MPATRSDLALPTQRPTLVATVDALREAGYGHAYGIADRHIRDEDSHDLFAATDFAIDAIYRFEAASDPDDESIVLALEDVMSGKKGVLIAAYGAMASAEEGEVLGRLLDWRVRR